MISWRVEAYEELGSTSDFCIERAAAGEKTGLAVTAAVQTAGRGSRGRGWQAPPGNLSLSVLLRPSRSAMAAQSLFPLLAGLAVAEAVGSVLPAGLPPILKWPNDVLLGAAKLAGVLIDAANGEDGLDWLVIGIGVNVAHVPDIPGRVCTSLAAQDAKVSVPDLRDVLLGRLGYWLDVMERDAGADTIRAAWLSHAHPLGTRLDIRASHRQISGVFAGLSPLGELMLAVPGGIETINTGEVLLGAA